MEKLPFSETRYRKELGAPKLFGESGYSTLERVWTRPTFEINGILGGFTGEGAKTVMPAHAMAKVSMRLVPNQDPDRIAELLQKYIGELRPRPSKSMSLHGGKPWRTRTRIRSYTLQAAPGESVWQKNCFCRRGRLDPDCTGVRESTGLHLHCSWVSVCPVKMRTRRTKSWT